MKTDYVSHDLPKVEIFSWNSRKLMRAIGLLAASILIFSCANAGRVEREWTEDVALPDGGQVKVKRRVAFMESSAPGGGAYSLTEAESTIEFLDEYASLPAWKFPWKALVLYRDTKSGKLTVIGTTSSCDVWWRNGRPIPKYWQFQLENDRWQQVPLSPTALGMRSNLFFKYEEDGLPVHISLAEKQRRQTANPRIAKQYQEVVSDPPKSCMNMRD